VLTQLPLLQQFFSQIALTVSMPAVSSSFSPLFPTTVADNPHNCSFPPVVVRESRSCQSLSASCAFLFSRAVIHFCSGSGGTKCSFARGPVIPPLEPRMQPLLALLLVREREKSEVFRHQLPSPSEDSSTRTQSHPPLRRRFLVSFPRVERLRSLRSRADFKVTSHAIAAPFGLET